MENVFHYHFSHLLSTSVQNTTSFSLIFAMTCSYMPCRCNSPVILVSIFRSLIEQAPCACPPISKVENLALSSWQVKLKQLARVRLSMINIPKHVDAYLCTYIPTHTHIVRIDPSFRTLYKFAQQVWLKIISTTTP